MSPASSGDEKELGYNSNKKRTVAKSAGIDSGLSEDHGSTGSSGGHPLDDLVSKL